MRNIVRPLGVGLLALTVTACSDDNASEPSPEAVLDMSCTELEQAWQSHRRGEWDAPGTFRLLTEEIAQEC